MFILWHLKHWFLVCVSEKSGACRWSGEQFIMVNFISISSLKIIFGWDKEFESCSVWKLLRDYWAFGLCLSSGSGIRHHQNPFEFARNHRLILRLYAFFSSLCVAFCFSIFQEWKGSVDKKVWGLKGTWRPHLEN
jgi:hypothetical protein